MSGIFDVRWLIDEVWRLRKIEDAARGLRCQVVDGKSFFEMSSLITFQQVLSRPGRRYDAQ